VEADGRRDYRAVIQLNWRFHFEIYRAAEMPTMTRLIETCWLQTGSYLNLLYPAYGQTDHGIRIHAHIVEAVERREAQHLSDRIQEDIMAAGSALLEAIRGRAGQSDPSA
jgi:DNA-binding GntR family transcriptional regulator